MRTKRRLAFVLVAQSGEPVRFLWEELGDVLMLVELDVELGGAALGEACQEEEGQTRQLPSGRCQPTRVTKIIKKAERTLQKVVTHVYTCITRKTTFTPM